MPTLSRRICQRLLDLVEAGTVAGRHELGSALRFALRSKPAKAASRERREKKRETRREKTASVRDAVIERAQGRCELLEVPESVHELAAIGFPGCSGALQLDHFFGGARRRSAESVEHCWMLCEAHHRAKTLNEPSASAWRVLFDLHRQAHGYPLDIPRL